MIHNVTTLTLCFQLKSLTHQPDAAPFSAGVPVAREYLLDIISKHSICTVCHGLPQVVLAMRLQLWGCPCGRPELQLLAWD